MKTSLLFFCLTISGFSKIAAAADVLYSVPAMYPTIQSAVSAVPKQVKGQPQLQYKIKIAPGIYDEQVKILPGRMPILLVGNQHDRTKVVIRAGAYSDPLTINSNNVTVRNLTVEQTASPDDAQQQAVVLRGRKIFFDNVQIIGNQDTLSINDNALAYFRNSQISGTVDFIYGNGTAFFENCTIVHRFNPSTTYGGMTTAPGTLLSNTYGFVFFNSIITREPGVRDHSAQLYRPWNPQGDSHGSAAFINCQLDKHIDAIAWSDWNSETENYDNTDVPYRSYEIGSVEMGNPSKYIDLSTRPAWTDRGFDPEYFSRKNVLAGWQPGL